LRKTPLSERVIHCDGMVYPDQGVEALMNEILEQKLKDLMVEAGRGGDWPVRAVLHMLLSSYRVADQKKFAKYCCDYSSVSFQMRADVSDDPEDFADAVGYNQYYH
jgi:hypothetical protein